MGLLDDLSLVATTPTALVPGRDSAAVKAYYRLRAFIEQHEPWYPPQQEGFGPWIEYDPGKDKGPRVGETVSILTKRDRNEKLFRGSVAIGLANQFCWLDGTKIVAYCVKLDEAKP